MCVQAGPQCSWARGRPLSSGECALYSDHIHFNSWSRWAAADRFFLLFFSFPAEGENLATSNKITQKPGARVLGDGCCRSAVTWVRFVNGMEAWPLCNCTGHCMVSISVDDRHLTLRAGAGAGGGGRGKCFPASKVTAGYWFTWKESLPLRVIQLIY